MNTYHSYSYLVFVLLSFSLIQPAIACSPAPDTQPASIAVKVQAASYVFQGRVIEVNESELTVQVEQYFKGNGTDKVKISGFNQHSCSDFLTVGQNAVFFAEGDINTTLSAIYDGAFGSTRQISAQVFTEITNTIECIASYHEDVLEIPCVAVKDTGEIYSANLLWQKSTNPMVFSVQQAQLKKPIPTVIEKPKAHIETIEILILESFPLQIHVLAKGYFSNGCGRIDSIDTAKSANLFTVTITTRSVGETCTQALVPFEETIPLDVNGLKAGVYKVDVNGISGAFELAIDNQAPAQ
ncbi:MAG: hypothetical protein GQ583_12745 [Methyloprofundus sp.]|nr:hypothetical protein [Methyloprofundus sp.]